MLIHGTIQDRISNASEFVLEELDVVAVSDIDDIIDFEGLLHIDRCLFVIT
jgi:hypothetical protein